MTRDEAKRILENIEFVRAFAEGKTLIHRWAELTNPSFQSHPDSYDIAEQNPDRVKVVWYRDDDGMLFPFAEGSEFHKDATNSSDYTQVEIEA